MEMGAKRNSCEEHKGLWCADEVFHFGSRVEVVGQFKAWRTSPLKRWAKFGVVRKMSGNGNALIDFYRFGQAGVTFVQEVMKTDFPKLKKPIPGYSFSHNGFWGDSGNKLLGEGWNLQKCVRGCSDTAGCVAFSLSKTSGQCTMVTSSKDASMVQFSSYVAYKQRDCANVVHVAGGGDQQNLMLIRGTYTWNTKLRSNRKVYHSDDQKQFLYYSDQKWRIGNIFSNLAVEDSDKLLYEHCPGDVPHWKVDLDETPDTNNHLERFTKTWEKSSVTVRGDGWSKLRLYENSGSIKTAAPTSSVPQGVSVGIAAFILFGISFLVVTAVAFSYKRNHAIPCREVRPQAESELELLYVDGPEESEQQA